MEKQIIGSLDRGIIILELLRARGESGVTELGRELGVNKSTAYRLLATLESHRFVERTGEGRYKLGLALAGFASDALDQLELRAAARPYLAQLAADTDEAVGLAVMLGNEGLLIDKCDSPRNIGATLRVGMAEPLYCTSLGKILLASFPPDERRRLLSAADRVRRTDRTVTDMETLLAESDRIASDGFTVDDEQFCDGMRCAAAPVFDFTGRVAASIGISAPISRLTDDRISDCVASVVRTARALSGALGWTR